LPQLLDALAESTRIESITASSAIEGVVVGPGRVAGLLGPGAGPHRFRNRNEREFAGYRDAIDEIMHESSQEPLSVPYVLHLHRLLFGHTDARGGYLKSDQDLIVSDEPGRRLGLFTPPSPREAEFLLPELLARYSDAVAARSAHPLLLIGALILDFLAIHPVADGNGRVARLLTTHELMAHGYEVARYSSIEQRMFETKPDYYDALLRSQRGWHEGQHDVWPWIEYLVDVLEHANMDLEERIAARRSLSAFSKQEQVRRYVLDHAPETFRVRDVRSALPGVSQPTIRLVLGELSREGRIVPAQRAPAGPQSAWRRV
jgi:Fic family protein